MSAPASETVANKAQTKQTPSEKTQETAKEAPQTKPAADKTTSAAAPAKPVQSDSKSLSKDNNDNDDDDVEDTGEGEDEHNAPNETNSENGDAADDSKSGNHSRRVFLKLIAQVSPNLWTPETLQKLFEKQECGKVESITLYQNQDGTYKNRGFILMANEKDVDAIMGRAKTEDVKKTITRKGKQETVVNKINGFFTKAGDAIQVERFTPRTVSSLPFIDKVRSLHIGGIPVGTSDEDLRDYFAKFGNGEIERAYVRVRNNDSKTTTGNVMYKDTQDARQVLEMFEQDKQSFTLGDSVLSVYPFDRMRAGKFRNQNRNQNNARGPNVNHGQQFAQYPPQYAGRGAPMAYYVQPPMYAAPQMGNFRGGFNHAVQMAVPMYPTGARQYHNAPYQVARAPRQGAPSNQYTQPKPRAATFGNTQANRAGYQSSNRQGHNVRLVQGKSGAAASK